MSELLKTFYEELEHDVEVKAKPPKNKRKKRNQFRYIGAENGIAALYFAIIGQVVKNEAGEMVEEAIRFPNDAETAIDVLFQGDLTENNSYIAEITRDSKGRETFRTIETIPTKKGTVIMQQPSRKMSGRQVSFNY